MTLEEMLRAAAANPEFGGLTVFGGTKDWQANATKDRFAWQCETRADIIEAIRAVIAPYVVAPAATPSEEDMLG